LAGKQQNTSEKEIMQASISDIYDMLLANEEVTLALGDEKAYNNLRVSLVKKHSSFAAYGIAEDSLCSSWEETTSEAKFWIGKPRRRSGILFEIIHHGKIRTTLESDSEERQTSSGSLSEKSPGTIDTSDSATEKQGQRSEKET
jgi:hypothetical protein